MAIINLHLWCSGTARGSADKNQARLSTEIWVVYVEKWENLVLHIYRSAFEKRLDWPG